MIRVPKNERRVSLGIFDSNLTVSGSRAGAFISGVLVLIAFIAIPLARPFLIGTAGVGLLVGMALVRRHTQRMAAAIGSNDSTILKL